MRIPTFVAIDFETADRGPDSACAVGLVRVSSGRIEAREHRLIRPPRRAFVFTHIHGITWSRVAAEPAFGELWPGLRDFMAGAEFLAAHNAPFDRAVLRACCERAGVQPPEPPFLCTVRLARRAWGIRPTNLPNVCRSLGLPLNHHEALSDAQAAAGIVLAAVRQGLWDVEHCVPAPARAQGLAPAGNPAILPRSRAAEARWPNYSI